MGFEAPEGIEALDTETHDDFLGNNHVAAVFYYADWCGPCSSMHTLVMASLASEVSDYCKFGYLDVQENVTTASRYGISSIPTLLIFKAGDVVDRIVGMRPCDELVQRIEPLRPVPAAT